MTFIEHLLCVRPSIICIYKGDKAKLWERAIVLGRRVKTEVDILREAEKSFAKAQHPLGFKLHLRKLGIEMYFLKLIKDIYKKSSINIILY